jgi:hypothetical protein
LSDPVASDFASAHYLPIAVRLISCAAPSTLITHVLIPFAVGLNVNDTVQVAPASILLPRSLDCLKSAGSVPAMAKPEIVIAAEVLLVMTTVAGTTSKGSNLETIRGCGMHPLFI